MHQVTTDSRKGSVSKPMLAACGVCHPALHSRLSWIWSSYEAIGHSQCDMSAPSISKVARNQPASL